MGRKSGSGSESGSVMNNTVKILKFFDAGLGSGMEKIRIRAG
jgi:hypothetical protein